MTAAAPYFPWLVGTFHGADTIHSALVPRKRGNRGTAGAPGSAADVGGQNAVDATGALVGGDDAAAQTRQVMANLETALKAAGAGIEHLVQVTALLVDGVDVQAAYVAAAASLSAAPTPPLVTAALVASLGVPGALVEVSAIAAVTE